MRTLIEVPTVGDVARRCDDAMAPLVKELRPPAREIEWHTVEPDLIAYVEADRRFHLRLLALGGNQHLVEVVNGLRARSRLFALDTLARRDELCASAAEHEQLVDLVLAADAQGASALMRRHIPHVRSTWAGRLEP